MKKPGMKKRWMVSAVATICVLPYLAAQGPVLPIDPKVRVGKLENGLTYYIQKNTTRPQLADFYIAQKVGSIQETPSQRGLAHFLEHMAFNGTTHFPGNEEGPGIMPWCETIGIKFGQNLNAYTSIDETVYNISDAPVIREGVIDSCLLILHDWSNDLLLTDEEIDKERGVIHEEWRTTRNAWIRMYEKALPVVYAGTKYADCLPIGNMEVVNHFAYSELRDYYEKWYRPDLQGIVVVGDIDPDVIEEKIKSLFSDIPAARPDAAPRIYYPVTDNQAPIVTIETDREATTQQWMLFFKHEAVPDAQKEFAGYLKREEMARMISRMLNQRLHDLQQKPDAPFLNATAYDGNFFLSKTKGAFTAMATSKEGKIEASLAVVYRELVRAARFGFTDTELERIKQEKLSSLETLYNERDTRRNREYVNEYVRNFLDNEPITGIEYYASLMGQTVVPSITLDQLNEMMKGFVTEENRVLMVFGPEKDSLVYPTPEDLLQTLKQVEAEDLTPYVETVNENPLVDQLPDTGKVVEEKSDQSFGTTVMTLSNGMTVVIKPTDFKMDQVLMQIQHEGGNSIYPDSDALNWRYAVGMVWEGGIGAFSNPELTKKLAGKNAWTSPFMNTYFDGVRGNCAPRDFETMMQLAYLRFTAPRRDEEAIEAWRLRLKESIRNEMALPRTVFRDSVNATIYGYNERIRRIQESEIDRIDYDRCLEIYRNTFADASGFTAWIVGNVEIDSIRPLVAKYLGALPSTYSNVSWKETSLQRRKGVHSVRFDRSQETPSARILIGFEARMENTFRNSLLMNMLSQILNITYTEKIREDEGGTYGVSVWGEISREPVEESYFQISFETAPEKEQALTPIVYQEIEAFRQNGPDAGNLAKVKEFLLKHHINNLRENQYWMHVIGQWCFYNMDVHTEYEAIVQSVTPSELQEFANRVFGQGNEYEVIMTELTGSNP